MPLVDLSYSGMSDFSMLIFLFLYQNDSVRDIAANCTWCLLKDHVCACKQTLAHRHLRVEMLVQRSIHAHAL